MPAGKRWYPPVPSARLLRCVPRISVLVAVVSFAWAGTAQADIDDSAYDTASQRVSTAARRAMDAELAQEKAKELAREREEREAEARAQAEREAALAARPYPVRLLEQRCTACHAAGHYMEQSHTLPGWWLVVLRMKVLNAAELDGAEMSVLAAHLTQLRPAAGIDAALEYAALPLLLAFPFVGWWGWRRLRGKKRGEAR